MSVFLRLLPLGSLFVDLCHVQLGSMAFAGCTLPRDSWLCACVRIPKLVISMDAKYFLELAQ
jgi:hypothetical protein